MASKERELDMMRQNMFNNISSVKQNFKSMTSAEKVVFTQQAFDDVNNYCSKLWNINPKSTTFGFMIGRRAEATTFGNYGSIAYSLPRVIDCVNPERIYQVMFHEMKHIHQRHENTTGKMLSKLYPSSRTSEKTSNQWLANPKEIESDLFSHNQMVNIAKRGLLKSTTRVESCKSVANWRMARIKNVVEHVKGTIGAGLDPILKPIQKLFCRPKQQEKIGSELNGGMRLFNLGQILKVFKDNPSNFIPFSQYNTSDSQIIRGSIKGNEEAHLIHNFFGRDKYSNHENGVLAFNNYKEEHTSLDPNIPQYTFYEDQQIVAEDAKPAENNSETTETSENSNGTQEEIVADNAPVSAEGNPELKNEIIANITASREASTQVEHISTEASTLTESVETGGMEP